MHERRDMLESEKRLELKLRREIEQRGGMAIKLTSQLHRGLPDRLVLMPGGLAYFVELKSTGRKPTAFQAHTHTRLSDLDFVVAVVDTTEKLDVFLALVDTANRALQARRAQQ